MSVINLMDLEINIDDPASISDAIMKVNLLRVSIKRMLDGMCEALLKEGVKIARIQLMRYGIGKGPLYNTIKEIAYDRATGIGYITAGEGLIAGNTTPGYPLMSYAIFVEEGFGSAKTQKAKSTSTWQPTLKLPASKKQDASPSANDGWVYLKEKDDHFYTSHGQPPKPFMYNTLMDLWAKAGQDASKYVIEYIPHE